MKVSVTELKKQVHAGVQELGYQGQDAAIIAAAQRVEHYEIAAYGTVRTYAEILGEQNAVSLLEKTLEEEKETDQKLTELAEGINVEAAAAEPEHQRSTNQKSKAARM